MQTRKYRNKKKGGRSYRKQPKRESLKMNCSPLVEGKTANENTCYTPTILRGIRDSYNKSHPESAISSDSPNEIWHELKNKLSECKKEDCWLKEIKDTQLQKDLDKYIFAPDRPPDWSENPNEWLSNIDILEVLRQYEKKHKTFKFIGPTPIDFDDKPEEYGGKCVWSELCTFDLGKYINRGIRQIGIIFNLDTHDKGGSHWVSLFICVKPHSTFKNVAFFFDSAGSPAPKRVGDLVSRIQKQWLELYPTTKHPIEFIQNAPHTHQYSNTECGMYSLLFIVTMLTGKSLQTAGNFTKKRLSLQERIHLFQKEKITDHVAETYRTIYFNTPDK